MLERGRPPWRFASVSPLAALALVAAACSPAGPSAKPPAVATPAPDDCDGLSALRRMRNRFEAELARIDAGLARSATAPPPRGELLANAERRLLRTVALADLERDLARGGDALPPPRGDDLKNAEPPSGGKTGKVPSAGEGDALTARLARAAGAVSERRPQGGPETELQELRNQVVRQLEDARKQKDVITTACVDGKLAELDTTLELAVDRLARLEGTAAAQGQTDQSALLQALRDRAERVAGEAAQCVGQDAVYKGLPDPNEPAPAHAVAVHDDSPPPELEPALARHLDEFAGCLPRAVDSARFVVLVRLDRDGSLREPRVRTEDDTDIGLEATYCVEDALARIRVSDYAGAPVAVSFPLTVLKR